MREGREGGGRGKTEERITEEESEEKRGQKYLQRVGGGSAAVVPVEVFREPGFFSSPGLLSVLEAETDGECVVGANDKMCE